jgi:hypothetical protein
LYPEEPSIQFITELCHLPAGIVPFSLVSVWYPAEHPVVKDRFSESCIHHNTW